MSKKEVEWLEINCQADMLEVSPVKIDTKVDVMGEFEGLTSIEEDKNFEEHMFVWDFMEWKEAGNEEVKEGCADRKMKKGFEDNNIHGNNCIGTEGDKKMCHEIQGLIKNDGDYLGFEEEKVVSLNLNYQDVLDAWSDRGPLWADNRSFAGEVLVLEEEDDGEEKSKRRARVLRYKEKRRCRLFSKKIRYQVRKVNAEKRPRFKGRFVKRSEDCV